MQTIAYLLILLSALVHASWNVLAKHVKGNTPALVFAHFFGAFFVFPFIFLDNDPWASLQDREAVLLLLGSFATHAAYVVCLSAAYVHGKLSLPPLSGDNTCISLSSASHCIPDSSYLLCLCCVSSGEVGLVYPLARGSPILFTAIGLQVLGVDDPLSPLAIVGMVTIIAGITFLCTEAFQKTKGIDEKNADIDTTEQVITNPLSRTGEIYSALDEENIPPIDEQEDNDVSAEIEMIKKNTCGGDETELCCDDTPSVDKQDIEAMEDGTPVQPVVSDRKKLLKSIAFAVLVGICSASYSTIDALGVQRVPPVLFLFLMDVFSSLILFPFLYKYHYDETVLALTEHKLTILFISPCVVGSYLLILVVFSLFDVSVALVVAVRTSSVLLGSFIGVVFLGERYSVIKFSSIFIMFIGIIIIKFS